MAKKGGNPENLVSNSELTPNERKERAKKAGKESGKTRAKNKTIRDALKAALEGSYDVGDKTLKGYDAIALKAVMEALSGNVQALNFVRDTIGEKPMDKVEHGGGIQFNSGGLRQTLEELQRKD